VAGKGDAGLPSGVAPFVVFYGPAHDVDTARVAREARVIVVDVDPDANDLDDAQIAALRAGGKNRVLAYLDVGSCESYRSWWGRCVATGALTTVYADYPRQRWANLASEAYRRLLVDDVAARLMARGVDGLFLDDLEVVEHGAGAAEGPCNAACAQGGRDLVGSLRTRFPDAAIVMQNALGPEMRNGRTSLGVPVSSLLDGVSAEEVYGPGADPEQRARLLAWRGLVGARGRPLWIGAEDYVGACSAAAAPKARAVAARAAADGVSSYVTDASAHQLAPCFWAPSQKPQ
jgi:cysteinyl-tRNA synthetase